MCQTYTNQQKENIQQFLEVTESSSPSAAVALLEKSNFDVNAAINSYNSSKFSSLKSNCLKTDEKLIEIFNKYEDPTTGKIEIEGTIEYLSDLDIEPEDPAALYLSYILDSPSTGVFERIFFVSGWSSLNVTNLKDMQKKLAAIKNTLFGPIELLQNDAELNETFKKVYSFTFQYILNSNNTPLLKKLDYEDCMLYWDLLLKPKYLKEILVWNEFISKDYKKAINKDAWNMLLIFLNDFHDDPKLEKYDEMASWPLIIDNFVEYYKENKSIE